jgi:murein DD-endopeptidase MepM/ murein hydrolase activator NlpD
MHPRTAWILFFAACAGCRATVPAAEFPTPVRYESPAASATYFFPTRQVSLTPTWTPSPTPRTYTVRAGDTFGSIAAKFGITVDELIRANPNVDPNALPIGQVLVIPPHAAGSETPPPTPTPAGLSVGPPACYVQPSGGKWCLALVENPNPDPVSSVRLRFSLYASPADDPAAVRDVALPLTVLPAGKRTVAAAFFPPEEAQSEIARVELTGAVRTTEDLGVLPVTILNERTLFLTGGLELTVEFRIDPDAGATAKRVDAVLTLLDSGGRPAGFRILRSEGDRPAGQAESLTLTAYSLGGEWSVYEIILQAREE